MMFQDPRDLDGPGLFMAAWASENYCKDVMRELVDRWLTGKENFLIENMQMAAINGYARGAVAARDLIP